MESSSQKSTRQLSTILFADIEGYTALMQKSEMMASSQLRRFQNEVQSQVSSFNGRVINFYGDGALCTFQNPLDAVQCGKALQSSFSNEPIVPTRIGIHLGTVVVEGDKIFGDSVNIASRIESMGIPGSVLISRKVRDEISNQPELETASLGKFEFKNVEYGMEVFALVAEGLIIPQRDQLKGKFKEKSRPNRNWVIFIIAAVAILAFFLWYFQKDSETLKLSDDIQVLPQEIRDKKVAVMVFENQTMDESLDAFGKMVSDFVTQGLIQYTDAKVVSGANNSQHLKLATIGPIDFAKSTNAEIVIEGRYYLKESSFLVHANIVDGSTGEVVFALPEALEGSTDNRMPLLKDLQQELLGYWVLKDKKWVGKNPPKFEAYQEYLTSLETWQIDQAETEKHLRKAFKKDSTFYSAILKLAVNYLNYSQESEADSCIQFLANKKEHLSDYEKMRFEAIEARLSNNNDRKSKEKQADIYLKMQEKYGRFGYNAVQDFSFTNQPNKAIEVFETWFDNKEISEEANTQRYFGHYLNSKLAIGNHEEVVQIMENLKTEVKFSFVALIHLVALVRANKMDQVDYYLEKYSEKELLNRFGVIMHPSRLRFFVCKELFLKDNKELLKQYAKDMFVLTEDSEFFDPMNEKRYRDLKMDYILMLFFNGELEKSLHTSRMWKIRNPDIAPLEAFILAEMNKQEEIKNPFDLEFGSYYSAIIELARGNKQKATEQLKIAFDQGIPFALVLFQNDVSLKDLRGFPPYEEFIKPRDLEYKFSE